LRARSANIAVGAAVFAFGALAISGPAQAALRGPTLESPASSASVESMPTFNWRPVKGAAQYEFQLSDDQKFNSIVLGRGTGQGSQTTHNTAATLDKGVPDGTYFWRVRAITAKDRVGRWSKSRALVKAWKTAPTLQGPADGFAVAWPSLPLLLRWSAVPHATKYLVTIATDPSLAQIVDATGNKAVEVPGTAFALQGTLPAGSYYWAITPEDAGGLRGTRSRVGTFSWSWPTSTTPSVTDLNATDQVFDPLLSWNLIPGAARYEVEINPDDDFAAGSRVCCKDPIIGTSLSPVNILPNNNDSSGLSGYNWRVRAFDVDGNPGQWNRGPTFEKAYDNVTPTVNVRLRDYAGPLTPGAGTVTGGPVIAWDPVPGAAEYQVQWTAFDVNGANCDWSHPSGPIKTASLEWTPLSPTHQTGVPGGIGITSGLDPNGTDARSGQPLFYEVATPAGASGFSDATTYCVRVRALSDDSFSENTTSTSQVLSQWSQIGSGENAPAFTYQAPPSQATDPVSPVPQLGPPTYLEPISATVARTPLLRWNPVAGARRYFVIIARDSNFTNVIDAAFTAMTAYAPNWVFEDEATSYFYAVIPAARSDGGGISGGPREYNPQTFNKLSLPPTPLGPVGGVDVATQPTFRWTPTDGAQKYHVQVSADPQFGELLDDVTTSSTAYTSSTPYPVDTVLYWRVRAEQLQVLKGTRVKLRWSDVGSFRRRLPAPTLAADIPLRGELPPALTWTPVPGAISYDLHIDQADGQSNDFNVKSAAGTFTRFFGIGTFKYRVRANFAARSGAVASAYSASRDFTRIISPPPGPRVTRSKTRLTFGWGPAAAATSYQVEVSTSESFSSTIESARTNNTSWAPSLASPVYMTKTPLYWRVATVDDGGNVGAFISAQVRAGKAMTVRVTGRLRRNARTRIKVRVRGSGKALRSASVRASGAGVAAITKRTGKSGTTSFRLRPTKKGSVTLTVKHTGYADKTVTVKVH
jgi:hypothetical protein